MITVANKRSGAKGVYIGRPSPLGNPFKIGSDGTRAEVIEKYREWLQRQAAEAAEYGAASPAAMELLRLAKKYREEGSLTLACWCAPAPCHGDVIADLLREDQYEHPNERSGRAARPRTRRG